MKLEFLVPTPSEIKACIADFATQVSNLSATNSDPLYFKETISQLIDFGRDAEAYEICEQLDVESPSLQKLTNEGIACIYRRHLDLLRKKDIQKSQDFFKAAQKSPVCFYRAQAFSAAGVLSLFAGEYLDALEQFEHAQREFFGEFDIDCLKMEVRAVMVLRILEKYDEANERCQLLLQRALKFGARAITPLIFCYATLGSNCFESGKKYEALRYLRVAAKLSKEVLPSSSAAFAMFQYGNVLLKIHSPNDARTWLERAFQIQRVCDPLAGVATRLVLVECYRKLKLWNNAIELARGLAQNRLLRVDPAAIGEAAGEIIRTGLGCHDDELIAQGLAIAGELEPQHIPERERLKEEVEKFRDYWRAASVMVAREKQKKIFYVDFKNQVGVRKSTEGNESFSLRKDSGVAKILRFLFLARQRGQIYLKKEELIACLFDNSKGVQQPSKRKQWTRAETELLKLGACEKVDSAGYCLSLSAKFVVVGNI